MRHFVSQKVLKVAKRSPGIPPEVFPEKKELKFCIYKIELDY